MVGLSPKEKDLGWAKWAPEGVTTVASYLCCVGALAWFCNPETKDVRRYSMLLYLYSTPVQ